MSEVKDINNPFREVFEALSLKDQRKAIRAAMRGESKRIKEMAAQTIGASGLGTGTKQQVSKSLRARVWPQRYGAGFEVTTKPHRKTGYHRNRYGKEKPVLMWAEEGTADRSTKYRNNRRWHKTGRMRAYRFLSGVESRATAQVENNLFNEFQANLSKAARKKGLL